MTGSVSQRPRRKPKADFEGPPPYELKKNETLYEISRNMQLSRWLDKDMESQVRFAARQIVQAFCLDKTVWERIGPERKANALQAVRSKLRSGRQWNENSITHHSYMETCLTVYSCSSKMPYLKCRTPKKIGLLSVY